MAKSRHPSHLIGERAERLFCDALPPEWVPRPQHPDYQVDYVVEVYEQARRTGVTFAVQLKGQKRRTQSAIKYALSTKDLAEYCDRIREPVFLCVADTGRRRVYYEFVQQYADEKLKDGKWRLQDSVTITIPVRNRVANSESFRRDVNNASKYMAERHPVAVEAAVKADLAKMQALDDRFKVSLRVDGGTRHYTIDAKQPVSGTLAFVGRRRRKHVKEAIEKGMPIEVRPGEVVIEGSPLFETTGHILRLEAAKKLSGTVTIRRLDSSGAERAQLPAIPFHGSSGTVEARVVVEVPHGLLKLEQVIRVGQTTAPVSITFSAEKWERRPILDLPLFDTLKGVFADLPPATNCRLISFPRVSS